MAEINNPHDKFFKATFGRLEVATDFLTHYLPAEEFLNLKEHLPTETGATMETMAEGWFNDGVRKGRREGRKEGRQEGEQKGRQEAGLELTLRLLEHRIGAVNARTQERLRQLSFAQLTELGIALLEFTSSRDLTAWLRKQPRKSS